jgi:hypothetical protein
VYRISPRALVLFYNLPFKSMSTARTANGMNSVAIRKTKCWTIRSVARRIHSGLNNAHRTKQQQKSDAINEHSSRTNWSKTLLGSARKSDRQGNPITPNSKPIKRQAIRPFMSVGRKSLGSESTRYFPSPLRRFLGWTDRRGVLPCPDLTSDCRLNPMAVKQLVPSKVGRHWQ